MAESLNEDPVYVAVSKDVGESRLTLLWALRNLRVKKLFLLHVHQLMLITPTSSGLEQSEIDAIQDSELTALHESLYKYRHICQDEGIIQQDVEILPYQASNVGEGIVELIYEHNIKKLIMGAAADSHYSEGMVNITSSKAEYVTSHAPHSCKIWLVCYGNLIQTREGRFDGVGSEPSSSLPGLDSALVPYEVAGRAERITEPQAQSSSEQGSTSGIEAMYYEAQRRRLEFEELKRENERHDQIRREREETILSSFGVTQILYDESRREAEAELSRAKTEIEDLKRVQKEMLEMFQKEREVFQKEREVFQKERDEAIKATEEFFSQLNLETGQSSSHSPSSPLQTLQSSVSNEPPQYFRCPISTEVMKDPHIAADGHTYEADEFKRWLSNGGDCSPMTNLKLENHNLIPNLDLRSAIIDWLQQHPYFCDEP